MKLPIGRFGSESPLRDRRMALDTAATAASWPIDPLMEHVLHPDQLRHLAFQ